MIRFLLAFGIGLCSGGIAATALHAPALAIVGVIVAATYAILSFLPAPDKEERP